MDTLKTNFQIIRKSCRSLKQAENWQNKFYGMYNHVRLITSPPFGEKGIYRWEVSQNKIN